MIESPCIKVCTLDSTGDLCLGCFRTLAEIGDWARMSDDERRAVMERLAHRREQHEMARRAGG